jgi:hypothetical protein
VSERHEPPSKWSMVVMPRLVLLRGPAQLVRLRVVSSVLAAAARTQAPSAPPTPPAPSASPAPPTPPAPSSLPSQSPPAQPLTPRPSATTAIATVAEAAAAAAAAKPAAARLCLPNELGFHRAHVQPLLYAAWARERLQRAIRRARRVGASASTHWLTNLVRSTPCWAPKCPLQPVQCVTILSCLHNTACPRERSFGVVTTFVRGCTLRR